MTANKPYKQFPRFQTRTEPADIKAKHGVEHVYRMSANETPLGPSPKAIAAMQEAAAKVGRAEERDRPSLPAYGHRVAHVQRRH